MLDNVGGGGVVKKNVRRSAAERAAIVAESYEPSATVARRHGIVASQLSSWHSAARAKGGNRTFAVLQKGFATSFIPDFHSAAAPRGD